MTLRLGQIWGRVWACGLVGAFALISHANGQDNNVSAVHENQDAAQKAAVAESIIAREEAASGRAFDPAFRAAASSRLASDSLAALESQRDLSNGGLGPKVLGDSQADLVYTPVTPCRIIDTRLAGGQIAAGTTRNFRVTGSGFTGQGGIAGTCGVPVGPATAAVINLVAVAPAGAGDFRVTPFGTAVPTASILNYAAVSGLNIANGPAITICDPEFTTCTSDFTIQADVSASHLVADVQGYFRNVSGTQDGLIWAGAHITGIGATPAVTRFFTKLPGAPTPTVIRVAVGGFEVGFGFNISTRFYQVVPGNAATGSPSRGFCDVTPRAGNPDALFIRCSDAAGVAIDNNFFVQVY